jgi:hypothetical protein
MIRTRARARADAAVLVLIPYPRLTPKPLMLFYHFFSVAFYSIYILLTSGPPAGVGEKKSGPPGWLELPGLMIFSVKVVSDTSVLGFRLSPFGSRPDEMVSYGRMISDSTRFRSSGRRAECSCR